MSFEDRKNIVKHQRIPDSLRNVIVTAHDTICNAIQLDSIGKRPEEQEVEEACFVSENYTISLSIYNLSR